MKLQIIEVYCQPCGKKTDHKLFPHGDLCQCCKCGKVQPTEGRVN